MKKILQCGFDKINFNCENRRALELKAQNLLESGHVFNVGETIHQNLSDISGQVIRQTSINKPPYCVTLQVSFKGIR